MPLAAIAGNAVGSAVGGMFNAREAAKNRSFQRRLSRTQYQRAADDLEKAGLNRILALGSPATTPTGATASMEAPQPGTTGVAAATAKQAIAQGKATEKLIAAQTLETLEKTRLTSAEAGKAEVVKGGYDALGPAAEKVFETMGNAAKDFVDSLPSNIGQSIGDRISGAARAGARRIWENSPASRLWEAGKEKAETIRNYWRRRN